MTRTTVSIILFLTDSEFSFALLLWLMVETFYIILFLQKVPNPKTDRLTQENNSMRMMRVLRLMTMNGDLL